jgi:hypothetical protein
MSDPSVAADSDNDHYLMVEKVNERLTTSKRTKHRFHMERFNLEKLHEIEGKEQYRVEVSNRFTVLGNLDAVKLENINNFSQTEPRLI